MKETEPGGVVIFRPYLLPLTENVSHYQISTFTRFFPIYLGFVELWYLILFLIYLDILSDN